jgi:predicted phosphodiesterase
VLAIALGGVLVGMRLAGSDVYDTDLGQVRLEVEPHWGGQVDAYVPIADWGLRAAAFDAPVRLRAEVRSLNRKAVLRAAGGDAGILSRTERQLNDAAGAAVTREALFAAGGGLLAGALAVLVLVARGRRRRRRLLLGTGLAIALTGLAIVGASVAVLRSTFDAGAFERPRFYANGAELLQLLDVVTKADAKAASYRSKVQGTLVRLSSLLSESDLNGGGFADVEGGRRALLASDLHANTLVIGSLERLAQGDRPIFFVGDFGHQGSEGEIKLLAPKLRRLGSRVIAVSGNHDSRTLMERLAEVGVTVLSSSGRLRPDGTIVGSPVIDVSGLRVAGWRDPLEWQGRKPDDPRRIFSFSELKDGDLRRRQAESALLAWFDALPERPDVVLVHQNGLAQYLAATLAERPGEGPLTILTGHDHKQHVDRHGPIVVVDAGSVGAGGVLGVGDERVGLGDLHFATRSPALVAADLIEAEPFTGGASAQRVIVEGHACADEAPSCLLSP